MSICLRCGSCLPIMRDSPKPNPVTKAAGTGDPEGRSGPGAKRRDTSRSASFSASPTANPAGSRKRRHPVSRSSRIQKMGAAAISLLAALAAFAVLALASDAGASSGGGGVTTPGAGGGANPLTPKGKHVFPVRGRHEYWDGFGAGRHHEGVDVGARCRTKLVATEAGRVQYKTGQSLAVNY